VYAYVAAATGWTWEYIGRQLTLPRLYALYRHWKLYPPVHVGVALIAQGLGAVKAPTPADKFRKLTEAEQNEQFLALRASMPIQIRQLPK
jgi:hypothetical protein